MQNKDRLISARAGKVCGRCEFIIVVWIELKDEAARENFNETDERI